MKGPEDAVLHRHCLSLTNYPLNFLRSLKSQRIHLYKYWTPPLSRIWLLQMSHSLSVFPFSLLSPFPAWQESMRHTEDMRGAEVMLSRSGAPVQAPGRMRCELHTSHQQLLFWLLFGTVCTERGAGSLLPALQKLPPELCVQKPNPACQISLRVTWLPPKHT